ncbi:MAG: 2'-5' RNA ligase family protein [Promethearchaeota archaeon]
MDHWTGIILTFDGRSSEKFRNLQRDLLETQQIPGKFDFQIPPHLTLMEHPNLLDPTYIQTLTEFVSATPQFNIDFSSIAYFSSTEVLFLNPKENETLSAFRSTMVELLCAKGVIYRRPPNQPWIPHSTILMEHPVDSVSLAIPVVQSHLDMQIGKPFTMKVTQAELFSYPPYKAEETFQFAKFA